MLRLVVGSINFGAISLSGTSTNARTCMRGCGNLNCELAKT